VRTGWLAKTGRSYAWMIGLAHAVMIGLSPREEPEIATGLVVAALGPLSWSAGAVAWGAARDLEADEQANGISAIAEARGATPREQQLGRLVSTIRVVISTILSPALLLLVLAAFRTSSARTALASAPIAAGVVGYSLVLGAVLGALSRASARAAPRYGRTLFALIVIGPLALGSALRGAPSVIGGLSWLLERISRLVGVG